VVGAPRQSNDHHWRERDPEERHMLRLLHTGEKDKELLKREIHNFRTQCAQIEKKKKKLRHNVVLLEEELAYLTTEKDTLISNLKREVAELRELKDMFSDLRNDDHKEQGMDLEAPKNMDKKYRRFSVSSAPQKMVDVLKRSKHADLYQKQFEIDDLLAKTDIDISYRGDIDKRAVSQPLSNKSYGRSRHRKHGVSVSQQKVEAAAHSFLEFFCKLKPKVLKLLWKTYVETRDREGVRVLYLINLPTFLHNLIRYIFRQDNPEHPLPSKRRTRPLATFLEYRLNPYVGSKKRIYLKQFLKFPVWLTRKELESPNTSKKAARDMSADEINLRRELAVGSRCKIWSAGGNAWFSGEVIAIQHDTLGEWLVVQYNHDRLPIVKEVQRFSKLLDLSEHFIRERTL